VFLPVHDDREHVGVDYELYRGALIYIWDITRRCSVY
jgi:hypothetical protein